MAFSFRKQLEAERELAAHQQRLHPALDVAEPDQVATVGVAVVEEGEIAPAEEVAEVARRLVVEGNVSAFVQPARQMGDLLVGREVLDRQVQAAAARPGPATVGIVEKPVGEVLIGEAATKAHGGSCLLGTGEARQREAGGGACQNRAAAKRQRIGRHLGFPQFLQAAKAASDEPSRSAAAAAKALHQPTASNIRPPPAAPIMMANWMTAT